MDHPPSGRERSGGRLSWRLDIETEHERSLVWLLLVICALAVLIAVIVGAVVVTR